MSKELFYIVLVEFDDEKRFYSFDTKKEAFDNAIDFVAGEGATKITVLQCDCNTKPPKTTTQLYAEINRESDK